MKRLALTAREASAIAKIAKNTRSSQLAYALKEARLRALLQHGAARLVRDTRPLAPVNFAVTCMTPVGRMHVPTYALAA
jgi:hypothetical protein